MDDCLERLSVEKKNKSVFLCPYVTLKCQPYQDKIAKEDLSGEFLLNDWKAFCVKSVCSCNNSVPFMFHKMQ